MLRIDISFNLIFGTMLLSSISRFFLGKHATETSLRTFSLGSTQFDNAGSKPPGDDNKKKEASKKLQSLLESIIKDDLADVKTAKEVPRIEVPQPRLMYQRKKAAKKEESKKVKSLGQKIVEAAQEVAKTVDGDSKETEAQLLHKLLYKDSKLNDEIAKAAPSSLNIREILSDMKVEKEQPPKLSRNVGGKDKVSRADEVRIILARKTAFYDRTRPQITSEKKSVARVNIFGDTPLGIFKRENVSSKNDDFNLETWDRCYNTELRLNCTQPPSNIYEQMILWTERGMLWKFPIDNEQGMEEEKQVDFSDHVFLEAHLEGWCPEKGPVRHFMELVCVGLSRNHWLTAKEKKDHIMWYKDYFSSKRTLLKEIGAGEISKEPQAQL